MFSEYTVVSRVSIVSKVSMVSLVGIVSREILARIVSKASEASSEYCENDEMQHRVEKVNVE